MLPPRSRARRYFVRTIANTKVLWSLFLAGVAIVSVYVQLRPAVSVEPGIVLDPGDPYSTQFEVTNTNPIFGLTELQPSCYTVRTLTKNNVGMSELRSPPVPMVPSLGPGEKTTTVCRPFIGGIGGGAGQVVTAYVIMTVSYRQDWWPFVKVQHFPVKGVVDVQRAVHWTHITASEIPKFPPF